MTREGTIQIQKMKYRQDVISKHAEAMIHREIPKPVKRVKPLILMYPTVEPRIRVKEVEQRTRMRELEVSEHIKKQKREHKVRYMEIQAYQPAYRLERIPSQVQAIERVLKEAAKAREAVIPEVMITPSKVKIKQPPVTRIITIPDIDDKKKRKKKPRRKVILEEWEIRNPIASMEEIMWGRGAAPKTSSKKKRRGK